MKWTAKKTDCTAQKIWNGTNTSTVLKEKKHGIQLMLMVPLTALQMLLMKKKPKKMREERLNKPESMQKEHGMKLKEHGMKLKFGVLNF